MASGKIAKMESIQTLLLNSVDLSDAPPDFDADWYSRHYRDVVLSGLPPLQHYLWLGRRLKRPYSSNSNSTSVEMPASPLLGLDTSTSEAEESNFPHPYENKNIHVALKSFIYWLLKELEGQCRLSVSDLFNALAPNFTNPVDGYTDQTNPNGRLLIDTVGQIRPLLDYEGDQRAYPSLLPTRTILLATQYAPSRAHAGGLRILDLYAQIKQQHPHVHLTLLAPYRQELDAAELLSSIFDSVVFCDESRFLDGSAVLSLPKHRYYDIGDVQFHGGSQVIQQLRPLCRRVLFTPMESLSRSEYNAARTAIANGELPLRHVFGLLHWLHAERRLMAGADLTVCVSSSDAAFLSRLNPGSCVTHFPTGLSAAEFPVELAHNYIPRMAADKPNRLVFAAYFGSHTNVEGLLWFLEHVHPHILAAVPSYRLAVVGRGDISAIKRLGKKSVDFIGETLYLGPVFAQAKAGLVLAKSGAGFRGKITQYAVAGLPSISTSLGSTGLTFTDGNDILIRDDSIDFANACVAILRENSFTDQLAKNARATALERYTWPSIWPLISKIYSLP